MTGTLGSELGDLKELTSTVEDELIDLRGSHGRLTIEKFGNYPTLRRVCGGGDLLDAFLMFEREMDRYLSQASRDESAAAISIAAPADSVLDRLEHVVGRLPQDGVIRDQRTGRRWSDTGIRTIARDLVYMADIQGRLGSELLTIEVTGNLADGLTVTVEQLTTKQLNERSPLVRLWCLTEAGELVEDASDNLTVDLDAISVDAVSSADHILKSHRIHLKLPEDITSAAVDIGDPVYSISIESRDAPMRTVTFKDESNLGEGLRLTFTTYRTIAAVEIVRSR